MADAKKLVAYYSLSGKTAQAAQQLAEAIGADLYEIEAAEPYTAADINWRDKQSRCMVEERDQSIRPALASAVPNTQVYNAVFVGFPIWFGHEPAVVDTFLDQADLSHVTVVPFCTSGGSKAAFATKHVKGVCPEEVDVREAQLVNGMDAEALAAWVDSLGL